jgi:hypothetical protein
MRGTIGASRSSACARPLLHIEVFTGDGINAFISRSRARAQQLDPKSRNLLLISKGAKLV